MSDETTTLLHRLIERTEALTDRVETQSELIRQLLEPTSSDLPDALRALTTAVRTMAASMPGAIADEVVRRLRAERA